MTPEFVIQIGAPAPDKRPARLYQREGEALTQLSNGAMELSDADCARLGQLLPVAAVAGKQVGTEGERLYARLYEALGAPLATVLDGPASRIYLELLHTDLLQVPWEIMVWPSKVVAGVIQLPVTRKHHLSRLVEPDWTSKPVAPHGPLRMLIVIGAPEDPNVDAETEERVIRRMVQPAQRTIDIDTITPADRAELYKHFKKFRPHVLHFIGHGQAEPTKQLRFKPDPKQPQQWNWSGAEIATDIGTAIVDDWKPRLVFLNACRTDAKQGGGASLAGAFLSSANAVIAMQGDIVGKDAGELAGEFYRNLAASIPLTEALSAARKTIAGAQKDKQAAFAALTSRCVPTCALPSFHFLGDSYVNRMQNCKLLPRLRVFVNQVEPRRKLCGHVWPFLAGEMPRHFMLLRGQPGYGKSILGAWLLDLALRIGHRVRYVRFDFESEDESESEGIDCIAVLDLIWNAQTLAAPSPLTDPLPDLPSAFAASLQGSRDPTPLYAQFLEELRKVSSERPVTIVLDHLRQKMDPGGFWLMWKELFVPVARGDLPNVYLLLSLSKEDYDHYEIANEPMRPPDLSIPTNEVMLDGMPGAEFAARFREYACFRSQRFRDHPDDPLLASITDAMLREPPQPISMLEAKLTRLNEVVNLSLDPLH